LAADGISYRQLAGTREYEQFCVFGFRFCNFVPFSSDFHRDAGIANEARPSQPTTVIRIIIPPAASLSENTEASEVGAFLFLCAADFIRTHAFSRRK
jgi:hypothetical protein